MTATPTLTIDASGPAGRRPRPLRVMHALLSLDCGGMEHVVADLVRFGMDNAQDVHVLCLERPGDLAAQVLATGASMHCLKKPPGLRLGLRKPITALLTRIQPDVLHTHQIGTLFYTGPPARRLGVSAIVHTEHGQEYANRRRTRWLGRLAARHARTFFCVSDDTARHVLKHRIAAKNRVHVVYNGIDVARFEHAAAHRTAVRDQLGIPPEAPLIGSVGRLAQIKRYDVLIHAFATVRRCLPTARLLLVGDGPKRQELADLAAGLGLRGAVYFLGYRDDRQRYLSAIDVFVLSSDSEGTPLALLEAWAAGLPVVVTRVGGLPELIEHRITGRLVPPGDSGAFGQTLTEVLRDEEQRRRMGQAGYELVRERFDRNQMARRYDAEYRALLGWTQPSAVAATDSRRSSAGAPAGSSP